MPVTKDQLISLGVSPVNADKYVGVLNDAFSRFEINTPNRKAAFLAQVLVESRFLSVTSENLNYTTPERILSIFKSSVKTLDQAKVLAGHPAALANVVYAKRLGNGDQASGDGWKFRGRGALQITGRTAYSNAAAALGKDYVNNPDLVSEPEGAILTACWYWKTIKGNYLADSDKIDLITKAVNGPAMLEKEQRAKLYAKAKAIL